VIVPEDAPHSTTEILETDQTPVVTEALRTNPAVVLAVTISTNVPVAALLVPVAPPKVKNMFDEAHVATVN
jgi:hypothetical protein